MTDYNKTEIETLSRSLAETFEELSFIYRLNTTMNVTTNLNDYFQNLAVDLKEMMVVKAVLIVLWDEKENSYIHAGNLLLLPPEILKIIKEHRDQQVINSTAGQILAVPISRGEHNFGIVAAITPVTERKFNNIDLTRLASVTNSVSVFLENFRLYQDMRSLFLGSLKALTSSIDAKDPYTCGHSERVALYSKKIITSLEMPAAEADRVYICGLVHDIGKIGMPESVLGKPGKPTDEEFEIIKRHPAMGAKIITGIKEMEDLVPAVRHHHERMDGKGYPDHLSGMQIPFRARVLCVADTLDAMTSNRPYRNSLSIDAAINELKKGRGTQFDSDIVEALLKLDVSVLVGEIKNQKNGLLQINQIELPEEAAV